MLYALMVLIDDESSWEEAVIGYVEEFSWNSSGLIEYSERGFRSLQYFFMQPSKLIQAVTLLNCNRQLSSSNLGWIANYFD
jgi:hypothetical protein